MNRSVLLCLITAGVALLPRATCPAQGDISFNRDIRPLLSDKCFQCHGPDENARETDLRFDQKQSAFQDLGGYRAIVPGQPDSSALIQRVEETDPDLVMPPRDSGKWLTAAEKQLLRRWIEEGGQWSEFWAYVPPQEHPLPEVNDKDWPLNWIDQMVLARLEAEGVSPAPSADRVSLLRRVHFDLTGLPPSPQDVANFLADQSPVAFNRVVERLLASPHFGERQAIHWLDLVRYADTVGYHGDQDHNISPYRDWVINALNDNMPFDQFTREQLAGDLLPNPTLSQKIASGYNRLLQTTHEGGLQPREYRAIYAADRVRNVSVVWMGATLGCAQCHDHKYDPFTARDFYSMAAFFADIDDEQHFKVGTNALPTRRPPELLVIGEEDRKQLDKVTARIQSVTAELKRAEQDLKRKDAEPNNAAAENVSILKKSLATLRGQQKQIESRGTWTMVSQPLETPRVTRILPRGNWLDESGPVVEPALPRFLDQLELDSRPSRLDLANWMVDPARGGRFTARVMANRIWAQLMGVGISRSLDDFGGQGHPPSHPELLDNLALHLLERDWDLKDLVRQIVTSRTYQQSSVVAKQLIERDPYNRLFARQSRYRLPAEIVRDNALAISGLINLDQIGGRSIKPYQPAGYYRHLNFPPRKYRQNDDRQQWRRGVYVHWQRQFLHPSLKAFDAPTREECTAERPRSNTPLAALSLMNDPIFVEAARGFSARILRSELASDREQLDLAFQLAVSRNATDEEAGILLRLLNFNRTEYQQSPENARKLASLGNAPVAEDLDAVELAAWTHVARAILNLDETITRN